MCHSGANVWALFDEDVQNYMGTTATSWMSYEHYDKRRPKKGFGSAWYLFGAAMKPNVNIAGARPDLFGPALTDYMKRAARGLARINVYGEVMPNAENRVELSSDKDEYGLPIARIIHSYDQDAIDLYNNSRDEGFEIVKATNPKEVWKGGGTAAGNDPPDRRHHHGHRCSNSVTNSYGQTHELANLYVGGAGLFPTEGSVNPTNTHHGGDAARRRAHGEELQHDRELSCLRGRGQRRRSGV